MTKNKLKLFELMGKSDHHVCWLHPRNVPFVRANYPDVPIACAIGNRKWWFLNGENSFYFKNDRYASYKAMVKSEEKIRRDLIAYTSYTPNEDYFLEDGITLDDWDKIAEDINELYARDGMSDFLRGETRNEGYIYTKANRPSYFLPQGARIKANGLVGTLEYPKTYRICDEGFHKNLKLNWEAIPNTSSANRIYPIEESWIQRVF